MFLSFPFIFTGFIFGADIASVEDSMYLIWVIGAIVLFPVSMLIRAWYVKVYIRRYYYDVGDAFISIKKGVFAPGEVHIHYPKVQDVYVDQDILDRMLGIYDVHLATATVTSGIEAHIDGVNFEVAQSMQHILLAKVQNNGSTPSVPRTLLSDSEHAQPKTSVSVANISNHEYPISDKWIVHEAMVSFFQIVFLVVPMSILFIFPTQTGPVLDALLANFGINTGGITAILWIAFLIIVWLLHVGYVIVWRMEFSFEFLPEFIVLKQGVVAVQEKHMPYRVIQDVTVTQGIIERLLGIATVRIENAATEMVAQGRNLVMVNRGVLIPGQPLERAKELSDVIRGITLTRGAVRTGL